MFVYGADSACRVALRSLKCISISEDLLMKVNEVHAERSKARVCGRSLAGIAGSNIPPGSWIFELYVVSKDKKKTQNAGHSRQRNNYE